MWIQSLGQEDCLEHEMETHCNILAWKIPRTEKPGRLQTMGSQSQTQLSNWARTHTHPRYGNKLRVVTCTKLLTPSLEWIKWPVSLSTGAAALGLFFFSFIFISWRLILYNIVVVFVIYWHESAMDLHVFPIPIPPSHLPLHLITLGLPSAPGLSTCLMHPTWAGDLFHPR